MTHIIKTNCDKSHQTPAFPRVDRGRVLPERVLAGGGGGGGGPGGSRGCPRSWTACTRAGAVPIDD